MRREVGDLGEPLAQLVEAAAGALSLGHRCRLAGAARRGESALPGGGGFPLTSTAASEQHRHPDRALADEAAARRPPRPAARRSSRGRTTRWWNAPNPSATTTSAAFSSSTCPYGTVQRSLTRWRRTAPRYVPARTTSPIDTPARREKRRNASRRASGAAGQTTAPAGRGRRARGTRRRGAPSPRARRPTSTRVRPRRGPRARAPTRTPAASRNAGQSSQPPIGEPGQEDEGGDERVAERHRDERDARSACAASGARSP